MGIQINGNTNNINAGIGSLSIEDIHELDLTGIATASNFKTGTSNVHSTGYECTNINASGIITATKFVGPFENTGDFTIDDYIVHAGDTNTKFGFPAVDTFTVETNNTERFRIKSNGYTGVGNFSSKPTHITDPLNVDSGIGTCNIGGNYIHLSRYSGGGTNYITAPQNNANLYISADDHIVFGVDHSSSIYTHGTEAIRITSTGRIEIGAGTGVFGSAPIEVKVSSSSGWTDYPEHISFVDQKAYNASDNGSGIVFSGKYNNSGSVTTFSSIHSKKANTTDGNFGGILTFNTREHGNSNFERMRIDSVGRVFINSVGATTPTADYRSLNIVAHAHSEAAVSFSRSHTLMGSGTTNGKSIILMPDGALSFQTHNVGERLRITNNGKIGINNNDPGGRTGSIDTSSNDSTSGRSFTDMRGHSSLILRNPNTTQNSFTQMSFINGGGTQAATLLRHRLGSSHGSLQNYVGDLCLFRRTGGNGGANNDYRESVRWCGSNPHARQIWWAYGDNDTAEQSRLGWHHLSAQRDHPGTDAYSFFRLETGAASYARQGWGKYTCAWTTGHASGYGLATGHFGYYMHHNNSRIYVNEHIIYRERYSNGSYYSWDDAPNLRICNYTQSGGTNAAIVFRCGGRRYSGGFDMGVMVGLFIDLYVPETANGDTNPRLYVAGNSQSNLDGGGFGSPVNHDYCTFQSSNPNHGAQP